MWHTTATNFSLVYAEQRNRRHIFQVHTERYLRVVLIGQNWFNWVQSVHKEFNQRLQWRNETWKPKPAKADAQLTRSTQPAGRSCQKLWQGSYTLLTGPDRGAGPRQSLRRACSKEGRKDRWKDPRHRPKNEAGAGNAAPRPPPGAPGEGAGAALLPGGKLVSWEGPAVPARGNERDPRGGPQSRSVPAGSGEHRAGPSCQGSHLAALALLVVVTEADGRQAGQVESGTKGSQQQEAGRQQPHLPAWRSEGSMSRCDSSRFPGQRLSEAAPTEAAALASQRRRRRGACAMTCEALGAILSEGTVRRGGLLAAIAVLGCDGPLRPSGGRGSQRSAPGKRWKNKGETIIACLLCFLSWTWLVISGSSGYSWGSCDPLCTVRLSKGPAGRLPGRWSGRSASWSSSLEITDKVSARKRLLWSPPCKSEWRLYEVKILNFYKYPWRDSCPENCSLSWKY